MTGLPPEAGTAFLNIVGEIVVREGGRFQAGEITDELGEGSFQAQAVVTTGEERDRVFPVVVLEGVPAPA